MCVYAILMSSESLKHAENAPVILSEEAIASLVNFCSEHLEAEAGLKERQALVDVFNSCFGRHYELLRRFNQGECTGTREELLERHASLRDINSIFEEGTILIAAVRMGSKCVAEKILEFDTETGDLVRGVDKQGRSPLFFAGSPEMVELLISRGADSAQTDDQGDLAVHILAENDRTGAVMMLLRKGVDIEALGNNGCTALHRAASPEMAWLLIKAGISPDTPDDDGNTPLHLARKPDMVRCLLEMGAAPTAVNGKGETPLHTVISSEAASLLIDKGAVADAVDKQGNTPLHTAANAEIVKTLLGKVAARAYDSVPRPFRLIPDEDADRAEARAAEEQARLALEQFVSRTNDDGETALHRANDVETVKMLLRYGAFSNHAAAGGVTPLCRILDRARNRHQVLLNRLPEDSDGWSIEQRREHHQCCEQIRGMVCLLLDAGADPEPELRKREFSPVPQAESLHELDPSLQSVSIVLHDAIAAKRRKQEWRK